MKSPGSTREWLGILPFLRQVEATGTFGGEVKFVDIEGNAGGESELLGLS